MPQTECRSSLSSVCEDNEEAFILYVEFLQPTQLEVYHLSFLIHLECLLEMDVLLYVSFLNCLIENFIPFHKFLFDYVSSLKKVKSFFDILTSQTTKEDL